jgi:hypothetical protein
MFAPRTKSYTWVQNNYVRTSTLLHDLRISSSLLRPTFAQHRKSNINHRQVQFFFETRQQIKIQENSDLLRDLWILLSLLRPVLAQLPHAVGRIPPAGALLAAELLDGDRHHNLQNGKSLFINLMLMLRFMCIAVRSYRLQSRQVQKQGHAIDGLGYSLPSGSRHNLQIR